MLDYAWLGIVVQFIDENKKDVKHVIESLDDIYNYEDEFFKAIDMYEHKEQDKSSRRLMIIAALANVLLVLQCEYWSFIIYGSKHI